MPTVKDELSLNDMILISVSNVSHTNDICTFERLVFECFKSFPKNFGFRKYPDWPDSSKLNRPLRKLREQGYLKGGAKTQFALTELGIQRLKNISHIESDEVELIRPATGTEELILQSLLKNKLFQDFNKDSAVIDNLDMREIRRLLGSTSETSITTLKNNLIFAIRIATEYKENNLLQFLKGIDAKYFGGN